MAVRFFCYIFFVLFIFEEVYGDVVPIYDNIRLSEFIPTKADKQILSERIRVFEKRFDNEKKMLLRKITSWNYHTDAVDTTYHEVRGSLHYAVALMDYGDEICVEKALDIIRAVLPLQDKDVNSVSCGVWPYYLEEPLHVKKSPIDYNWADFNAVSLLDIYIYHYKKLPEDLKLDIKNSLILAAKAIQKRNCELSYTNIAIMGTYVTYMVSHLFEIDSMKLYSQKRLKQFYDYTITKNGFTEYNSPTYTMVALDELNRMQRHISEPTAVNMINELYDMGWKMIARHYHKTSGQWAGPHSRAYPMFVENSFYDVLSQGTRGIVKGGIRLPNRDVKITHTIPKSLLKYFVDSDMYPRMEVDTFEVDSPQIIGKTYLTEEYVFATASHSCMWTQRRPFTAYWGTRESPSYLRVRLLHDFYDFSSGLIQTKQDKNKSISAITIMADGGDKHISIDKLQNGKFNARDLRVRFELGNCTNFVLISLPNSREQKICIDNRIYLNIYPLLMNFGDCKGRWESGYKDGTAWLDYVFYSGDTKVFDLSKIREAVFSFAFMIDSYPMANNIEKPCYVYDNGVLSLRWNELELETKVCPSADVKHY